jgi:tetratricopeptide (TPR) repeat protein
VTLHMSSKYRRLSIIGLAVIGAVLLVFWGVNSVAENLVRVGDSKFLTNDYPAAREAYSQALVLKPFDAKIYNKRGLTYLFEKNYKAAFPDLNRAVELDPKFGKAYSDRGDAYYFLDDSENALKDYSKCMELDPLYANAYLGRGVIFMRQGLKHEALADFSKFLAIAPADDPARKDISRSVIELEKSISSETSP